MINQGLKVSTKNIDVIVWAIQKHSGAIRNPHMFGWINEKDGKIKGISVKTPLENPEKDQLL